MMLFVTGKFVADDSVVTPGSNASHAVENSAAGFPLANPESSQGIVDVEAAVDQVVVSRGSNKRKLTSECVVRFHKTIN
jgi:hypothetical protein